MSTEPVVKCVFDGKAKLGSSPLAAPDGSLYWIDISAGTLHNYTPETPDTTWEFNGEIGAIALGPLPDTILLAFQNTLELFDARTGTLVHFAAAEDIDPKVLRFNDGKCDAKGRFWVGTYDEDIKTRGGLYCLDLDGSFTKRLQNIAVANGLAWSPDNRIMYHADSVTNVIYAYDYDIETGDIGDHRIFADLTASDELPGGAAVDDEGNYWLAILNYRKIVKFSPSGERVLEITVPVPQPTTVAFGGPDYKTLYITTCRQDLKKEELRIYPQSGGLFGVQAGSTGLPAQQYVFTD